MQNLQIMIFLVCMIIFFVVLVFFCCSTPMYSAALLILAVLLNFLLLNISHSALFASYLPYMFLIVYVGAIIVVIGYVCSITPLVKNLTPPYITISVGFRTLFLLSGLFLKFDLYWNRLRSYVSASAFSPADFIFHHRFIFFFIVVLLLLLFLLLIASSSVPAQSTLRRVRA